MIAFQYPAWLILVCIAAGIAYAYTLYRKDTVFISPIPVFRKLKWLLFAFRALSVSIIAILLLTPLIKTQHSQTEKPLILIARDNSASIPLKMSAAQLQQQEQGFQELKKELGDEYSIESFRFGTSLQNGDTLTYKDQATNIADAMVELYNRYGNQNVGAVILASDGIYNQGSNPVYNHGDWLVPFYTVALGDTTIQKDAYLGRIYYNKTCYLHDQSAVKIDINANYLSGMQANVEVQEITPTSSILLAQKNINYTNTSFSTSFDALLDAKTTGIHHYRVKLATVSGEATAINNVQDFYIEVLDARQKILLLAAAPHPDLGALKSLIESNNNYDCTIAWANEFNVKTIADYNLVILHQFPAVSTNAGAVLKALNEQKMPVWYILGSSSNLAVFNQQQGLIQVNGRAENTNEVLAKLNKNFNSFIVNPDLEQAVEAFPPLLAPFAEYRMAPNAAVMAYQKVGAAVTHFPLLVFGEINGNKVGVLCGEGIWRWKMYDYLQHQNFDASRDLVSKTVQLLIAKNDKRKFKANPVKSIFYENETIDWEATLYNDNYEFINTPDVTLSITDAAGKSYNFTFNKSERSYSLNTGFLPVGSYTYTAKTNFNAKDLSSSGNFSISPLQLEGVQTSANHQLLHLLSAQTGGQLVYPNAIKTIADQIKKSELIKPVIYTTNKTTPALYLKWIFFLILLLLSAEWFIRKYNGGY